MKRSAVCEASAAAAKAGNHSFQKKHTLWDLLIEKPMLIIVSSTDSSLPPAAPGPAPVQGNWP